MTTYTYEPAPARPRRRWGRRLLIVFIVLLVVLGGLLVVADRVAASVAERAISDRVAQELTRRDIQSSTPVVGVGGFPFLTQVLDGKYKSITIGLRDLEGAVEGDSVRVPKFDATARDVTASIDTLRSGEGDVVAQTVTGTGTIEYASVVDLMNAPGLRLSERDGRLFATGPVEFAGQRITVSGSASDVTYENGRVRIRFDQVTAEGVSQLPGIQALLNQFARQLSVSFALPELPFKLDVSEVRARPEGLVVDGRATNVPLNQW